MRVRLGLTEEMKNCIFCRWKMGLECGEKFKSRRRLGMRKKKKYMCLLQEAAFQSLK